MNGFLFDMPPEPKPNDRGEPLSHRHDPQTSREAARRLRESGRLTGQRKAVLEALRQGNWAMHVELGRFMGRHWLVAARRLPELERMGLVRKGESLVDLTEHDAEEGRRYLTQRGWPPRPPASGPR